MLISSILILALTTLSYASNIPSPYGNSNRPIDFDYKSNSSDEIVTVSISDFVSGFEIIQKMLLNKYPTQLRRRDLNRILGYGVENQKYGISPGSYFLTTCTDPDRTFESLANDGLQVTVTEDYFQAGNSPLDIRMIITGKQQLITELFDEVWTAWNKKTFDTINLHYNNPWALPKKILKRPLSTVYLPSGMAEDMIKDLERFGNMKSLYRKFAIPYRRGYLLSGPPGTGKTSVIHALASEQDRPIVIISFDGNTNKEDLMMILDRAPENAFIVIEDVDALYTKRETFKLRLSFSDFINIIDGLSSKEGTILVMTTNHIDNIDPALLRPGRADRHFKLGYATKDQIQAIFMAYIPEQMDRFETFYEGLPTDLTTATLQRFFFSHFECENILEFKEELMVLDIDPINTINLVKELLN